jgi:hypothetical protein
MPITLNGTTGITTPALVNGTALAFRNKIINGNFGINQRGYVSGTATSGANQYTLDRWRVVTSGQNLTFSASGTGNIVTAPAGGIEQVIESLNIEGGTYTLSWTGTATGAVNGSAISNGGQVTLTANTNATIKFSSGTVSLVQLEAGSVATPFENRPIGIELALCQRYYEKLKSVNGSFIGVGAVVSATGAYGVINYSQKRENPTISVSANSDFGITTTAGVVTVTSFVFASGITYSRWDAGVAAGLTAGQGTTLRCANSTGFISIDIEL